MSQARVLVVDDDLLIRETLHAALCDDFAVSLAESGEACLQMIAAAEPDLLLLDIEMPGLDGYEVCRRIRAEHSFPIIFISGHDSLAEQLRGFEVGADDFVTKPFNAEVLFHQVRRVIERHRAGLALALDKEVLEDFTTDVLRDLNQTDVLLNFMRHSIGCSSYRQLAVNLLDATKAYGVACHVQIRYPDGAITLTGRDEVTPVDEGVFLQCLNLGRVFRFSRRMIINFPSVSILLLQTPDDEALTLRLQERLAVLAESSEAIGETIEIRRESASRAEALQVGSASSYQAVEELRDQYRQQQEATREQLQQLVDDVEATYLFLGLTERQEATVSDTIRNRATEVLKLFERSEVLEAQFSAILDSLTPSGGSGGGVSLF